MKYAAKRKRESFPVVYVTWYNAIRFANWMHNGQGSGDTETGTSTLGDLSSPNAVPPNGATITHQVALEFVVRFGAHAARNLLDDAKLVGAHQGDVTPTSATETSESPYSYRARSAIGVENIGRDFRLAPDGKHPCQQKLMLALVPRGSARTQSR
jgi:hypothetical protein